MFISSPKKSIRLILLAFQEDVVPLVCSLSDWQLEPGQGVCPHLIGRFCTLLYAQHIDPFN